MHGGMNVMVNATIRGTVPFSYALGPHWFAVYANIKCERRAQAGLDGKGFRTFLPLTTKWVSHARVRTIVKRPLMSRYFFVEIDPHRQSFEDVRQTDGIESIVGTMGVPQVIPSGLIERFIFRQISGEFDEAAKEPLINGAKVQIVEGEWDTMIGIIIKAHSGSVLLKLLDDRRHVKITKYGIRAVVS
jgi:transcription antitermination factor NusG